MSSLITTPRDIIRFTNTFEVTYSGVKNSVNESDFIAIEMLRMFKPFIYYVIKNNKNDFTRLRQTSLRQDLLDSENLATKTQFEEFLDEFIPTTLSFNYRESRRLCSLEYVDVYFSYSSNNQIFKEFDLLFETFKLGSKSLANLLTNIIEKDINEFVDFLMYIAQSQQILSKYYSLILQGLFEVSDLAIRFETTQNNIRHWIIVVIERLFSYSPMIIINEVYDAVGIIIRDNIPTYMSILLVRIGIKTKEQQGFLVDESKIQSLRKGVMPHIYGLCELHIEFDDIKFRDVINLWIEIEPDEARNWLVNQFENRQHFLQFIEPYIRQSNDERITTMLYRYLGTKENLTKIFQDAKLSTDEIVLYERLKRLM